MAHRSGDAKAILLALTLLAVVQAAGAKKVVVGGATQRWDFPPGTDMAYYDTWTAAQSFTIGDQLVFEYLAGEHDVQHVSASEYSGCTGSSTNATLTTGYDFVFLLKTGDYYFQCTFPSHCIMGMKLKVTVAPPASVPSPLVLRPPSLAPPPLSQSLAPLPLSLSPPPPICADPCYEGSSEWNRSQVLSNWAYWWINRWLCGHESCARTSDSQMSQEGIMLGEDGTEQILP